MGIGLGDYGLKQNYLIKDSINGIERITTGIDKDKIQSRILSTGGLEQGTTGLFIKTKTNGGIETDVGGVYVKLKTSGGITNDLNGLSQTYLITGIDSGTLEKSSTNILKVKDNLYNPRITTINNTTSTAFVNSTIALSADKDTITFTEGSLAKQYRDQAQTAKTQAETAKTAAETAKVAAETAKVAAEASKVAAQTSATASQTSATASASSATASAGSATASAGSATAAAGSAATAGGSAAAAGASAVAAGLSAASLIFSPPSDGRNGDDGEDGNGISSVFYSDSTGLLTLNFTKSVSYTTTSIKGTNGTNGTNGIDGESFWEQYNDYGVFTFTLAGFNSEDVPIFQDNFSDRIRGWSDNQQIFETPITNLTYIDGDTLFMNRTDFFDDPSNYSHYSVGVWDGTNIIDNLWAPSNLPDYISIEVQLNRTYFMRVFDTTNGSPGVLVHTITINVIPKPKVIPEELETYLSLKAGNNMTYNTTLKKFRMCYSIWT